MGEWVSFPEAEQLLPNAERAQRQRFPVLLIPKKQSPETSDWFVYWFVKTVMAPCQRRRGNRSAFNRQTKERLLSKVRWSALASLLRWDLLWSKCVHSWIIGKLLMIQKASICHRLSSQWFIYNIGWWEQAQFWNGNKTLQKFYPGLSLPFGAKER